MTLVERFVEGQASSKEEEMLLNYYESFQESDAWPDGLDLEKEVRERIYRKIKNQALQQERVIKMGKYRRIYRYAAIFIGLVGMFYVFKIATVQQSHTEDTIVYEPEKEEITLKLANGEVEVVSESAQREILDKQGNVVGLQQGAQITYNHPPAKTPKEIVYNELNVPYGKKFDLVLSDGTKIKLNAGSVIKYPIQFLETGQRKVFLKGEAYFDVFENKDQPFVVNADEVEVEVLGTEFNMSYYPEDTEINTVLVEGSVKVLQKGTMEGAAPATILEPGYKAEWHRGEKKMAVQGVDIDLYTAWTEGRIVFKNIPFKNIRKKLERHYDVTIENNNKVLDEKKYNAAFDIETIEQVLESFSENYAIEYRILDDKIVID